MISKYFFIFTALAFVLTSQVLAQPQHFTDCSTNTGSEMYVGIPLDANPMIGDQPLQAGDEIAAFTAEGLCASTTVVWDGLGTKSFVIWGDNTQTGVKDGFSNEEPVLFRVWRKSTGVEYSTVAVEYASGLPNSNGLFVSGGISALDSLEVVECTDDWGAWSEWSACVSGEQSRARSCSGAGNATQIETQSCRTNEVGGGAPGAAPGTDRAAHTLIDVQSGDYRTLDLMRNGEVFFSLNIDFRVDKNNVNIEMTRLGTDAPTQFTPPGLVYEYVEIIAEGISEGDADIELNFLVPKDWLSSNNARAEDVALMRYHNGEWAGLQTRMERQDENNYYFAANTPGFSYFAITAMPSEYEDETDVIAVDDPDIPVEFPEESRSGFPWLFLIVGVVLIVIVVVAKKAYDEKKRQAPPGENNGMI